MSIENNDEFSLSTAWTAHKDFKKPFKYTVESSNQTVLLQRLDMPDLLKLGIAQEMDFMSKTLMAAAPPGGEQKANAAVADAVKLADNFGKMETMINKVVARGCLKPKLHLVPEHENARQEGLVYIDNIPWDDRMELFSVIFETQGLSDFREEQNPGMGNVADVQDVQLPSNGPVADVRSGESEGVLFQ